jgi:hypothetical protein
MFGIINRGELDSVTEHEIENLNSRLKGLWLKEHNDDGTHKELSLDAIPVLDSAHIPNLDASIITTGTVAEARLPSSIAYEDEANTFSVAGNSFSEVLGVSKGLLFPATQVENSDPNGLDDYEEGTWTPTVTFATPGNLNVVYVIRSGYYTKIGRKVTAQFVMTTSTFTHTTASGFLHITGLGFTPVNTNASGTFWHNMITSTFTQWVVRTVSANTFDVVGAGSGVNAGQIGVANLPTGVNYGFVGNITFFV